MIRLAVVGTNFITDRLLSALPLSGQFSLTAVYSRSLARAEEYGKAHGASYFYNSLEELAKMFSGRRGLCRQPKLLSCRPVHYAVNRQKACAL